jgi:hypothetical protein
MAGARLPVRSPTAALTTVAAGLPATSRAQTNGIASRWPTAFRPHTLPPLYRGALCRSIPATGSSAVCNPAALLPPERFLGAVSTPAEDSALLPAAQPYHTVVH